jgi:hypothetical protein
MIGSKYSNIKYNELIKCFDFLFILINNLVKAKSEKGMIMSNQIGVSFQNLTKY